MDIVKSFAEYINEDLNIIKSGNDCELATKWFYYNQDDDIIYGCDEKPVGDDVMFAFNPVSCIFIMNGEEKKYDPEDPILLVKYDLEKDEVVAYTTYAFNFLHTIGFNNNDIDSYEGRTKLGDIFENDEDTKYFLIYGTKLIASTFDFIEESEPVAVSESFQGVSLSRKIMSNIQKEADDYVKLIDDDLSVYLDEDEDLFKDEEHKDMLGCYEPNVEEWDEITIGINDAQIQLACEEDGRRDEIEKEIEISIWHEIGHGIIDHFKDFQTGYIELFDFFDKPEVRKIMNLIDKYEEDVAEQFGQYMGDGNSYYSDLNDLVQYWIEYTK
jgi:hypothetical protein